MPKRYLSKENVETMQFLKNSFTLSKWLYFWENVFLCKTGVPKVEKVLIKTVVIHKLSTILWIILRKPFFVNIEDIYGISTDENKLYEYNCNDVLLC